MSEFKIVKCKKCNASLVELQGEKLTQCVQCGHSFTIAKKQTPETAKNSYIESQTNKGTPEIANLVRKLRQMNNSRIKKTSKISPAKKKSTLIRDIIFFIILFNVLRNIF